jgi:hypothetical protein
MCHFVDVLATEQHRLLLALTQDECAALDAANPFVRVDSNHELAPELGRLSQCIVVTSVHEVPATVDEYACFKLPRKATVVQSNLRANISIHFSVHWRRIHMQQELAGHPGGGS